MSTLDLARAHTFTTAHVCYMDTTSTACASLATNWQHTLVLQQGLQLRWQLAGLDKLQRRGIHAIPAARSKQISPGAPKRRPTLAVRHRCWGAPLAGRPRPVVEHMPCASRRAAHRLRVHGMSWLIGLGHSALRAALCLGETQISKQRASLTAYMKPAMHAAPLTAGALTRRGAPRCAPDRASTTSTRDMNGMELSCTCTGADTL